ncbi:hypothetical protein N8I77_008296 [Diaporthe amygdali]|uniref:Uncharacterized protein n=1 Tax=Phomopsis amygdali TaxID=1214568 RepID=A0AAD9SDV9_PHOAM|nr:uncharacterized protein J7T55_007344 [Diaporthe amygdali]KAJ0116364.1 hypothetical protein J7T55_007344 [Diaporthe amygdali]KAK2605462.1 hypothetical protein N8I77_008296 [Diaporthe amygdali]
MPSSLNPSGSNDNCFFVTAAYLLGLQNVNELPQPVVAEMNRLKGKGMFPHDGVSTEMEDCLKQMGHPYLLKTWAFTPEGSEVLGGQHGGGDGNLVWRGEQFLFGDPEWNVDQIGIGYATKSGTYHFIVVKDTNPPSYVCFQHNTSGTDKWMEVRGREEEVNGNWHDVILQERSKVLCAFAFKDVSGNKEAPKPKTRGFWSKFCCFC